jgi:hypothetical protein
MAILVLPAISDLASFSGRPESSYTTYGNAAILQAVIQFQTVTELQPADMAALETSVPEDYQLAFLGILALADWIYLRQPYQAAIATPLMSETIGSYSYAKAQAEMARNAAALEVTGEAVGIPIYDLAVRMLAKRTRAGGVFSGAMTVFEHTKRDDEVEIRWRDGRMVLEGPADRDEYDAPFMINGQSFPMDPGI